MLLEIACGKDGDSIVIPKCLNVLMDVTNDDDYKNINLGIVNRYILKKREMK